LEIKALGTSFNVKAYPSENLLTATLVEGSIKVEGNAQTGEFSYTLKPKQNITLVTASGTILPKENVRRVTPGARDEDKVIRKIDRIEVASNVNTELYTSWKDRRWVIEHESFLSFAEMLERRYNVNIAYDPAEMHDISFSGTIENETLEQVISILQLSAPLKYKFGKGEVEISLDKSQMSRFKKVMDQ
jgi:ferric-dicitrate binding protein FerR (iron transport regulator)